MGREILRLEHEQDFSELLSVLDRAFNHGEGGFVRLLPKLYRATPEQIRCHYAVRQDGRVVAGLGAYPLRWRVNGEVLDVAGIGGVGTDPDFRGQGLMSELLDYVVADLRRREFTLSWLGGQRQRYRHYGWEKCGCLLHVGLTKANVRHEPELRTLPSVRLEPLDESEAAGELLAQLHAWHDAEPMHCVREPESFEVLLRHWRAQPYVAYSAGGEPVGYAVVGKDNKTLVELGGCDATAQRAIVRAVIEQAEESYVTVVRSALPGDLNRWLGRVGEGVTCWGAGNWQVFDWPRVIGALLRARGAAEPLPAGEVVLGMEGEARALRLAVSGDEAEACWCEAAPSLTLDAVTMTRLLFGPVKPSQVVALPTSAAMLEAWCPLPASIPSQDKV